MNADSLGPRSLDILDTVVTKGVVTVAEVAEDVGCAYGQASAALRRLLKKRYVVRQRVWLGRYGSRPARWAATPSGRARLAEECERGRRPGLYGFRWDARDGGYCGAV